MKHLESLVVFTLEWADPFFVAVVLAPSDDGCSKMRYGVFGTLDPASYYGT